VCQLRFVSTKGFTPLGCAQFCAYPRLRCRKYTVYRVSLRMHIPLGDGNGTVPGDAGKNKNVATRCFTETSESRVPQRIGDEGCHA
jgi:hypothetical protein